MASRRSRDLWGTTPTPQVSIGSVFGPRGDVVGYGQFTDGETNTFQFTNSLPGRFFQFVIRKTVNPGGYALYRAYPTDGAGRHFPPAISHRDTLAYTLAGSPAGASLDPATGLLSWVPDETQGPGTNTITVTVSDNGSPALSATNTFTVVVNEVNRPPVLPSQPNVTYERIGSVGRHQHRHRP